jgi:non-specific serine/threonine protein kinase
MRVSPAPPRGPVPARPHNLPAPLTRLIGRAAEVAAVRDALLDPEIRLLTLVGAPGIGKTRLALAVAQEMVASPPAGSEHERCAGPGFADGVCLVPLAPLRDPDLVVPAIAQAVGVREAGGQSLPATLQAALRDRRLLLVLDNCEHLPAAAPLVGELLAACRGLTVLATSRAPLHLYGEHQYPVPPLALPDLARLRDPHALTEIPAVALLVERARAVRPDFRLTPQNAPAVAELCVRLDGLPLALELAAARLKLLPPGALLARLGSRLDLLADGARDRPARHQTLRAALAWSHDLLSAGEQRLLRRLAVFVGGWTLEAAEAVCAFGAGEEEDDGAPPSASSVFDRLAMLVDQSLVQQSDQPAGEPRFVMLETIREYGLERLKASGEAPVTRRRHAEYYLELMAAAAPELWRAEQTVWLKRLQGDFDNLRAALAWSRDEAGQGRVGGLRRALRTAPALGWLWSDRGHFSEARRWLEWMLAASDDAPTPARARALNAAGFLAFAQGEFGRAFALHEVALLASRALADELSVADSLRGMGIAARHQGAVEQAAALLEESLALYRRLGDSLGVALALKPLSLVAQDRGDYDLAMTIAEESVALLRAHANKRDVAHGLHTLGFVAWLRGRYRSAEALCKESLVIFGEVGVPRGIAIASCKLGLVAWRLGDARRAASLLTEGLMKAREVGDREWIGIALNYLASVACDQQEYRRAARLLAATEAIWAELGAAPWPASRVDHECAVRAARSALGEEAFAAAFEQGQAMTLEEAVADARSVAEAVSAADAAAGPLADRELSLLTPREQEVAALVARGLTDAQLAGALVIGRRTAEKHVANCLGKLGLATRAGLAAWVVERGLPAP